MTLAIKAGGAPADEISEGSPEGWTLTTLGYACEINPPKASKDALPANAPVTFVPMPAVDADQGAITKPQTKRFSEVRRGFTSFRENDVIMAKITPCMENGKAAIARNLINGHGFGSTEFHVFRSTGAVLPEFMYHFVRREVYRRAAEVDMTGSVGQKRVPKTFLETTELQLPPLSEQHRIVTSLTELLNTVKSSQEKLNRVPAVLKRFRQAVLAAACSGRLTADWRENNFPSETGDQLCRSVLGQSPITIPTETPPIEGLPDSWAWTTLGQVSLLVTDGDHNPPKRAPTGIPHLTAKSIKKWQIKFDDCTFITKEDFKKTRARYEPHEGDLIITCVGTIGETAIVPKGCIFSADRNLAAIRLRPSAMLPTVAQYVLNAPPWINVVHEGSSSTAQPHLYLKTLRALIVPLIPVAEQREIVHRTHALFNLADKIERLVRAATLHTDKLTQSILAKAFRGELVLTEAELARREGRTYEPASVLLERVKKEREAQHSGQPMPKRSRPDPRSEVAKGQV